MKPPRRSHIALRAGLLALVASSLGCASLPSLLPAPSLSIDSSEGQIRSGDVSEITPRGPGFEFSSIEDAAIDALSYCYLAARQLAPTDRAACGGVVRLQDGGFIYDEPVVAGNRLDSRLRYRLGPDAVAHFRHEPRSGLEGSRSMARHLARESRRFVERKDVMHRPIFTLSPRRFVRMYAGDEGTEQVLARVDRAARRGSTRLALRSASDRSIARMSSDPMATLPEHPFALRERPEPDAER